MRSDYGQAMTTARRPDAIAQLKTLLAAQAPFVGDRERRPTGMATLDRLLGGGLPRGAITVLTGPLGAGRRTVAAGLCARETAEGRPVAWIDANRTLYPPALSNLGVDLSRLLLVRGAKDRSWYAAEQIAASGAFSVMVATELDAGGGPSRARRLQTSTEGARVTTVLVLDPAAAACFPQATLVLRLERRAASIHVRVDKDRTGVAAGKRTTIANRISGLPAASPAELSGHRSGWKISA
jgi:hypothetical protein